MSVWAKVLEVELVAGKTLLMSAVVPGNNYDSSRLTVRVTVMIRNT